MAEISWKELTLFNPNTQKYWQIEVDGNKVRTCLNHGKNKEKQEQYPVDKAIQAVMAQFRKGFVYINPNAAIGEPIMHRYVDNGQAYTGFMPIAARTDREDFYIVRVIGNFEDEILYHYHSDGQLLSKYHLGAKRMTYHAFLEADGTLWFDNSHIMEHFDPEKEQFLQLDDDRAINEGSEQVITYGHLQADFHTGRGNIEIWNYQSEKLLMTIKNEFTVRNLNCAFSSNSLIVHTDYGVLSIYRMEL